MADLKGCPFGQDVANDCKNCDYGDTHHFDVVIGQCVKRQFLIVSVQLGPFELGVGLFVLVVAFGCFVRKLNVCVTLFYKNVALEKLVCTYQTDT